MYPSFRRLPCSQEGRWGGLLSGTGTRYRLRSDLLGISGLVTNLIDPVPGKWDWTLGCLAHLDVETTGLVRPGQPLPLLLEVGVVLTDHDLKVLDCYEAVIRHDPEDLMRALEHNPVASEMHRSNGLWHALLEGPTIPLGEAEEGLLKVLHRNPDPQGYPVVWAGWSPAAIDRPLVSACMPRFYQRIHHRTLDLSSLKLALKNYAGVEHDSGNAVHRALPDAMAGVRRLRHYRSLLQCLHLSHRLPVTAGETAP